MDTEFNYEKYKNRPKLLTHFVAWYLRKARKEKALPIRTFFNNATLVNDNKIMSETLTGVTLYRQENLQVQMWMMPPNSKVPRHSHPEIDSYEVYFGGDLSSSIGDKANPEASEKIFDDIFLTCSRVKEGCSHGGRTGKHGGIFLSLQHWLNEKPRNNDSVHMDWEEK